MEYWFARVRALAARLRPVRREDFERLLALLDQLVLLPGDPSHLRRSRETRHIRSERRMPPAKTLKLDRRRCRLLMLVVERSIREPSRR